jgi:hypothetical protein
MISEQRHPYSLHLVFTAPPQSSPFVVARSASRTSRAARRRWRWRSQFRCRCCSRVRSSVHQPSHPTGLCRVPPSGRTSKGWLATQHKFGFFAPDGVLEDDDGRDDDRDALEAVHDRVRDRRHLGQHIVRHLFGTEPHPLRNQTCQGGGRL